MFGKKGSKGSGGGGSYLTPKNYMNTKGPHKGMYQKPNNDGNLFSRRSPWKKPGYSGCFITTAVTRAAGLPDDCYELMVLRMFRREYVAELPDGEKVLADYREKAPKVVQAIDELPGEDSQKVWECVYVSGVVPAVLLITGGEWDEAYRLYREMCEELEVIFLEENLAGYPPEVWVYAWIEAKLDRTPVEALDAAARCGVIPLETLEDWRSGGWCLHGKHGNQRSHRSHRSLHLTEEALETSPS